MPNEYEKFKELTGLNVSKATYYRIKRDLHSGQDNRLTRIVNDDVVPRQLRPAFKKHAKPDEVPFLGFDGEGITLEGQHKYVLMASGNGESIYRPNGISTTDALNFLLRDKRRRAIRVFYAFGYDVQQILVDVPDRDIVRLMRGDTIRYGTHRLSYLPGKIFAVDNVRFYDVFNFWQSSFIKAVQQSLGNDAVSEELIKGKESRGSFADWNVDDILRYTNEELDLLTKLCEHLRTILIRCGIHLGSAFYGPGSIANYWFKSHKISPPKITEPNLVDVMERGYYGGRFETFILGKSSPVYECDINSAYPAIIADLPYLDEWEWTPPLNYLDSTTYSIWKVEWHIPLDSKIGPFPSRDKHGLISYPANGIGWYWKPEIEAALRLYSEQPNSIRILGGYYPKVEEDKPFAWVREAYEQRLRLKEADDPAQQGLKLGLNSLYGKTAQRVGSARYFSLAWAGYITSATRAKLLNLAYGREGTVIAFATDAVYFNSNPSISPSNLLGEFGLKAWDRGYFIQSGVYRLELNNVHKDAYRGFSVKNGIQDILDQIKETPWKHPSLYQIKFIGHLEAIRCPNTLGKHRLSFITVRKRLQPFKTTKRRVDDSKVWSLKDLDPDFMLKEDADALLSTRGGDYISLDSHMLVWNYYAPLLQEAISTTILDNHNDHRSMVNRTTGALEISYPFKRLTERQDDIAFSDTDEIAAERIGGASGLLNISQLQLGNRPIVNEDDIVKELTERG